MPNVLTRHSCAYRATAALVVVSIAMPSFAARNPGRQPSAHTPTATRRRPGVTGSTGPNGHRPSRAFLTALNSQRHIIDAIDAIAADGRGRKHGGKPTLESAREEDGERIIVAAFPDGFRAEYELLPDHNGGVFAVMLRTLDPGRDTAVSGGSQPVLFRSTGHESGTDVTHRNGHTDQKACTSAGCNGHHHNGSTNGNGIDTEARHDEGGRHGEADTCTGPDCGGHHGSTNAATPDAGRHDNHVTSGHEPHHHHSGDHHHGEDGHVCNDGCGDAGKIEGYEAARDWYNNLSLHVRAAHADGVDTAALVDTATRRAIQADDISYDVQPREGEQPSNKRKVATKLGELGRQGATTAADVVGGLLLAGPKLAYRLVFRWIPGGLVRANSRLTAFANGQPAPEARSEGPKQSLRQRLNTWLVNQSFAHHGLPLAAWIWQSAHEYGREYVAYAFTLESIDHGLEPVFWPFYLFPLCVVMQPFYFEVADTKNIMMPILRDSRLGRWDERVAMAWNAGWTRWRWKQDRNRIVAIRSDGSSATAKKRWPIVQFLARLFDIEKDIPTALHGRIDPRLETLMDSLSWAAPVDHLLNAPDRNEFDRVVYGNHREEAPADRPRTAEDRVYEVHSLITGFHTFKDLAGQTVTQSFKEGRIDFPTLMRLRGDVGRTGHILRKLDNHAAVLARLPDGEEADRALDAIRHNVMTAEKVLSEIVAVAGEALTPERSTKIEQLLAEAAFERELVQLEFMQPGGRNPTTTLHHPDLLPQGWDVTTVQTPATETLPPRIVEVEAKERKPRQKAKSRGRRLVGGTHSLVARPGETIRETSYPLEGGGRLSVFSTPRATLEINTRDGSVRRTKKRTHDPTRLQLVTPAGAL